MGLFRKIGDWVKVRTLTHNLQMEAEQARATSLKRFGLKVEKIAKEHISNQDLPWKELEPATLANKLRKGQSENILTATSQYFQSITSWVDGDTVYAGVKKDKKYKGKDGSPLIANIAEVHEFGSLSGLIPARPLWHPSFGEALEWHRTTNQPAKIFLANVKRKYK